MSQDLIKTSNTIRRLYIQSLNPTVSHHIGSCLSCIDILTCLYFSAMHIDPQNPDDPHRDYFLLSKGHAAGALYATLCHQGFFPESQLMTFDQDDSVFMEHSNSKIPGVEFSTGSLGHALPVACGLAHSFIKDKKSNRVYVLLSDGELNEGSNWESFLFAGFHKYHNLTVIIDFNQFQGFGKSQEVLQTQPIRSKLESFGWAYFKVDGHDLSALTQILDQVKSVSDKPQIIFANTIKGKGIPLFEGKFESHYLSIDDDQKQEILKNL